MLDNNNGNIRLQHINLHPCEITPAVDFNFTRREQLGYRDTTTAYGRQFTLCRLSPRNTTALSSFAATEGWEA